MSLCLISDLLCFGGGFVAVHIGPGCWTYGCVLKGVFDQDTVEMNEDGGVWLLVGRNWVMNTNELNATIILEPHDFFD